MHITELEFIAPTKNQVVGSMTFRLTIPVALEEVGKELGDTDGDITFSEEVRNAIDALKVALLLDIKAQR